MKTPDSFDFLKNIYKFSKKSYIKANPMFKQFLFKIVRENLVNSNQNEEILTFLFLNSPFVLIKNHIKEAIYSVSKAISEESSDLNTALSLFEQIVDSGNELQQDVSLEELIKNLINLLKKDLKPLNLRKKVILCLGKCHTLEQGKNFKNLIIDGLKPMLDHHKRIIRQETAQALNIWYSI